MSDRARRSGTLKSDAPDADKGKDKAGTGKGDKSKLIAKPKFAGRISNKASEEPKPEDNPTQQKPGPITNKTTGDDTNATAAQQRSTRRQNREKQQVDRPKDIVAFGGGAYQNPAPSRKSPPYESNPKKGKAAASTATDNEAGPSSRGGSSRQTTRKKAAAGGIKTQNLEDDDEDNKDDNIVSLMDTDTDEDSEPEDEEIVFPSDDEETPTVLPWVKQPIEDLQQYGGTTLGLPPEVLKRIQEEDQRKQYHELEFLRDPELRQKFADEKRLFLMQFPPLLPFKNPNYTPGDEGGDHVGDDGAGPSTSHHHHHKDSSSHGNKSSSNTINRPNPDIATVHDLPSDGPVGRFLVLRSGKIKLQLGECLFDVNAGVPVLMRQEFMALDLGSKICSNQGQIEQRLVITPDFDFLLSGKKLPPLSQEFPKAEGGVVRPAWVGEPPAEQRRPQQQQQQRQQPQQQQQQRHDLEDDDEDEDEKKESEKDGARKKLTTMVIDDTSSSSSSSSSESESSSSSSDDEGVRRAKTGGGGGGGAAGAKDKKSVDNEPEAMQVEDEQPKEDKDNSKPVQSPRSAKRDPRRR